MQRILGSGGHSKVYECEVSGVTTALKVLNPTDSHTRAELQAVRRSRGVATGSVAL